MQVEASLRIVQTVATQSHKERAATYTKVFDARKRPIRGLWKRNDRFYARIAVEDPNNGTKQVRLVPLEVETVAQAQAELRRLVTKREDNALPILRRTPKFADYAKQYLAFYQTVKDAKRPRTLETEKGHLNHWIEHLGETRLDRITKPMVTAFVEKRQAKGKSGRTVNLGVTVLRNVLKKAVDDGWITRLPTENLRPLKWTPKKREMFSTEQITAVCDAALQESKNGQEFADYIRLMAFCGARMSETLRLKWSDVDWSQQQLTIGADGLAKNRKARVVDFQCQTRRTSEGHVLPACAGF